MLINLDIEILTECSNLGNKGSSVEEKYDAFLVGWNMYSKVRSLSAG